jgi:tetratricopeptide repeat protein
MVVPADGDSELRAASVQAEARTGRGGAVAPRQRVSIGSEAVKRRIVTIAGVVVAAVIIVGVVLLQSHHSPIIREGEKKAATAALTPANPLSAVPPGGLEQIQIPAHKSRPTKIETGTPKKEARVVAPVRSTKSALPSNPNGPIPDSADPSQDAIALAQAGNYESALLQLERAAAKYPNNVNVLLYLGRCQNQNHEFQAAAKTLTRAISLDGSRADLFEERARSFTGQGLDSRARDDLTEAQKRRNRSPGS